MPPKKVSINEPSSQRRTMPADEIGMILGTLTEERAVSVQKLKPVKKNENFDQLRTHMECLGLAQKRYQIRKSPSGMTSTDSGLADWVSVDDWTAFVEQFGPVYNEYTENKNLIQKISQHVNLCGKINVSYAGMKQIKAHVKESLPLDDKNLVSTLQELDGALSQRIALLQNAGLEKKPFEPLDALISSTVAVTQTEQGGIIQPPIQQTVTVKGLERFVTEGPITQLGDKTREFDANEDMKDIINSWYEPLGLQVDSEQDSTELSEMNVQMTVGRTLQASLVLKDMAFLTDKPMPETPYEFRMAPLRSGQYRPDLASVLQLNAADQKHLSPILLLGEAKLVTQTQSEVKGNSKTAGSNTKTNYQVQMQAYLYPTLVLLSLLYKGKTPEASESDTLAGKVPIPPEFIVYGFYYDQHEIQVYAHFPLLWDTRDQEASGLTTRIKFVQLRMVRLPFPVKSPAQAKVDEETIRRRLQLAQIIQLLRYDVIMLRNVLQEKTFTKPLADIGKLGHRSKERQDGYQKLTDQLKETQDALKTDYKEFALKAKSLAEALRKPETGNDLKDLQLMAQNKRTTVRFQRRVDEQKRDGEEWIPLLGEFDKTQANSEITERFDAVYAINVDDHASMAQQIVNALRAQWANSLSLLRVCTNLDNLVETRGRELIKTPIDPQLLIAVWASCFDPVLTTYDNYRSAKEELTKKGKWQPNLAKPEYDTLDRDHYREHVISTLRLEEGETLKGILQRSYKLLKPLKKDLNDAVELLSKLDPEVAKTSSAKKGTASSSASVA